MDIPGLMDSNTLGRIYLPQPHVLRISSAQPSDSGVYQCFIGENEEEIQAAAELVVRDLPVARLTNVFTEQTVHPGRSVYLHCFANGGEPDALPLSIVWSVDSYVVPFTSGR